MSKQTNRKFASFQVVVNKHNTVTVNTQAPFKRVCSLNGFMDFYWQEVNFCAWLSLLKISWLAIECLSKNMFTEAFHLYLNAIEHVQK